MNTVINPTPDKNGYELVRDTIPLRRDKDGLHAPRRPSRHVHATIEHSEGTTKGVVLYASGSLDQDTDYGVTEYNGFFLKLRNNDKSHSNVYADPGTGGASLLHVDDWEGCGGGRYKYPIENITLEIESSEPICRCGKSMVYGYSNEEENRVMGGDGSRGSWVGGWLCPDCFPGRINRCEVLP